MKCVKIRELLRDYLRQETDLQTRLAVTSHLGTCDSCARELAFLKAYYARVGSLPAMKAPDDFLVNVKQRLEQTGNGRENTRERKSPWYSGLAGSKIPRVFWGAPIAGVLTVALVVFLTFNPFQIGQKLRQGAKEPLGAPENLAGMTQNDESKEMITSGSSQSQSNSAPGVVAEERTSSGAIGLMNAADSVNGDDSNRGKGRQPVGEQIITFTMVQPVLRSNKSLFNADANEDQRKGIEESETDQNALSEKQVLKKEEGPSASNTTMVLMVKAIIKSLAGEIVREELGKENGQLSLFIRIPAQSYPVFLEKLREIGSVNSEGSETAESQTPAPSTTVAQSNQPQFIEARLILKGVF
jgi:hypothetical protein